jgi:hypothetical protein
MPAVDPVTTALRPASEMFMMVLSDCDDHFS